MRTRFTAFLSTSILLVILICTFSISCMLTAGNIRSRINQSVNTSLAAAIMDAGRLAVSAWLYEKADLYFHMGKPRKKELAFNNSFFQKLSAQLSPQQHVHRSGAAVREIVPWLWMAARADPHNIKYYQVASFWLAHEAGRSDIARNLLAEARWSNPFSYPIAMEDALIALKHGEPEDAKSLLDAGLSFWEKTADKTSDDSRHDKARMLLYRALLYEAHGNPNRAIDNLEEILKLFPQRQGIQTRISELKKGDQPSLLASGVWNDILRADIEKRKEHEGCEYDGPGQSHEAHE